MFRLPHASGSIFRLGWTNDANLKFTQKYLPAIANKVRGDPIYFNKGAQSVRGEPPPWNPVFATVRGEAKTVNDNDSQRIMSAILKDLGTPPTTCSFPKRAWTCLNKVKDAVREFIDELEEHCGVSDESVITVLLRDGSILADANIPPGSYRSTQDIHTDVAYEEGLEDARGIHVLRVSSVIVPLEEGGADIYVSYCLHD